MYSRNGPLKNVCFMHFLTSSIDLDAEDLKPLMTNLDLKKAILQQMDDKAKEYHLTSLEKIKKVHLSFAPFSVENDLITPTFKIKRNIAKKFFDKEIT